MAGLRVPEPNAPLTGIRRRGTVNSWTPGPAPRVNINLGGDTGTPMDVPFLDSYIPSAGDEIVTSSVEGDHIVLGAIAQDTTWHVVGAAGEPAYQNSWVAFDGTRFAEFRKDAAGFVHLQGLVKNGSVNLPIFTLPVGYRPDQQLLINVPAAATLYARMDIGSTGGVQVTAYATGATNAYVSLSGITFFADN